MMKSVPRHWGLRSFWLVIGLILTGCAPHSVPRPLMMRYDANLNIALTTQPSSPRSLDPTHFTVTLKDAQGQPVTGANARINLQMPTMDMGQNRVVLSPQSPGLYVGKGRFTMSGDWQMTVTATKGSEHATQSFPVTVQ
jgi:nitrogen fixation protein FixH